MAVDDLNDFHVIFGLGNPGNKYEQTRHNVGFHAIDVLARKNNIKLNKVKHRGLCGEGFLEGTDKRILLVKPQTYMNSSGECVLSVVEWYKLDLSQILVVYDDADLPAGWLRLRREGSSGSHNGMKSIIYQLIDDGFPRVRIGIGKQPEHMDLADYVLSRFYDDEIEAMDKAVLLAADACEGIIKFGMDRAMNMFNTKKSEASGEQQ